MLIYSLERRMESYVRTTFEFRVDRTHFVQIMVIIWYNDSSKNYRTFFCKRLFNGSDNYHVTIISYMDYHHSKNKVSNHEINTQITNH